MQQLHLVGFTTDLDSLIFSSRKGAKSGSFVLPLDERLLVLIAEAVRRRKLEGDEIDVPLELRSPASVVRRQSALSPREIQDRLRAGRSIEEVAGEAGVAEEWVGRFSAPVEAERSQIVARARRLVYAKPRRGESGDALGPSVRWNLADRGVRLTNDEFDDGWSAYQLADHTWMVTFSFVSRQREQQAEWEVDFVEADVLARNRLASDLGYLEPGRRRRSAASLQPGIPPTARASSPPSPPPQPELPVLAGVTGIRSAKKATKKAAASTRAAPRSAAAAKKAAPKRAAASKKPATPRGTAAKKKKKKAAAPKARSQKTAPAPARRGTTPRAAASRAGRKRAAASRPAAKRAGGSASGRGLPPAPTAAARPAEPASAPAEPNELSRRRLQLVTGGQPPAPRRSGMAGRPGYGGGGRPSGYRDGGRAASTSMSAPSGPPRRPVAQPRPEERLDVVPQDDAAAAAEARRAERRRARAEARKAANGDGGGAAALAREAPPAAPPTAATAPPTAAPAASRILTTEPPTPPGPDIPEGDGRVVTIRANRATPPRNEGGGEVILPANRPPLRPAQPAAQPRSRRRFGRTTR